MTHSAGLDVGSEVPAFSAPLVHPDGTVEETSLSALLDERPVLLSFYTNDFAPDCVEEWCSFRDYEWFASGEQVQVVGISKSRPGTHRRFIDHLDLQFPLFSDRDLAVAEAFDVKYRTFKVVARSRRSCFLVDQDRTVRYVWVGEHPVDPTLDTPPLSEIHTALEDEFGPEMETFGL